MAPEKYVRGMVAYGETAWSALKTFHLPHQCDEWIIGDRADALTLILDLQDLIAEMDKEESK